MSYRLKAAFTVAVLVVCAARPLHAQAQPQAPGQLDSSPSIFATLAAINAVGYDADLASPSNHPLRNAVRAWVASRKPAALEPLRAFVAAHKRENPAAELGQYISWALAVDGPPSFKPRFEPARMPPEAAALEGLSEIMADFYSQAELDTVYRQAQPLFEQVIERYHAPVVQAVFDSNAYLRNQTSGMRGRRFQIFIDLLGAPNQVHTRSFADDYFVVITPSAEPRIRDIRHAYLDYLIDPLAIRNAEALEKKKALGEFAGASPILSEEYKTDFVRLAGMCLVHAVEARLDRDPAAAARSMSEGFILTAYFYEALAAYEKQEQGLRFYMPDLIQGIDIAKEDARIAKVEFSSTRSSRIVRAAQSGPSPDEAALQSAEKLYEQRDYPSAGAAFRKLLEGNPGRSVQARAFFGLGRISIRENKASNARQFFERTLELEPGAFERSWSHIYLARLARAAQDPSSAAEHYQRALAVPQATDGALSAARQELAALKTSIEKP